MAVGVVVGCRIEIDPHIVLFYRIEELHILVRVNFLPGEFDFEFIRGGVTCLKFRMSGQTEIHDSRIRMDDEVELQVIQRPFYKLTCIQWVTISAFPFPVVAKADIGKLHSLDFSRGNSIDLDANPVTAQVTVNQGSDSPFPGPRVNRLVSHPEYGLQHRVVPPIQNFRSSCVRWQWKRVNRVCLSMPLVDELLKDRGDGDEPVHFNPYLRHSVTQKVTGIALCHREHQSIGTGQGGRKEAGYGREESWHLRVSYLR